MVPASYQDLDGIVARMNAIAAAYPAIAQVVDVTASYNTPATFEGRHLFALKVSDNVALDEDEPAMLIVAAHHAREIMTPVIALTAADRLTAGYDGNARITAAVDGYEIWIAPVWNPDGYNYVFTTDNFWRKNRRVFSERRRRRPEPQLSSGWSASCAGSTSVSSDTYKGPSAASEAGNPDDDDVVPDRAVRQGHRLPLLRTGILYAYRCLAIPSRAGCSRKPRRSPRLPAMADSRDAERRGGALEWQFARWAPTRF